MIVGDTVLYISQEYDTKIPLMGKIVKLYETKVWVDITDNIIALNISEVLILSNTDINIVASYNIICQKLWDKYYAKGDS